jgi:bifunctional non-homologous end joining protein LigD
MEVSAARYEPMPLVRRRDAFDDSAWLFELKWDGWRSLAYVNGTGTALVSRKGNRFRSFPDLASIMPLEVNADDAVLDGEIVKLDGEDRPGFVDLCGAEAPFTFVAFDVLVVNGKDVRKLALADRKRILRAIVSSSTSAVAARKRSAGSVAMDLRPDSGASQTRATPALLGS